MDYIKMDYSLTDPAEIKAKVEEIIASTPPEKLTPKYLEKLADYMLKDENPKDKKILTSNRLVTINKRETSYEGLVSKLESGEDGLYNMMINDKNTIFQPKTSITEQDLAEIPPLRALHDEILKVEEELKNARGTRAYRLRRQLIQMRQDQYVIKGAYKKPIYCMNIIKSITKLDLPEKITIGPDGAPHSDALISFFNPKHISALLCNYSTIKQESWDKVAEDAKWLMLDLEDLIEEALADEPLYKRLLILKIDGCQNEQISAALAEEFGVRHSVEYISSLWRNKIPKLISKVATERALEWYYTNVERGEWKRCNRCGRIKLAHNAFFSRNNSSKSGWYSICKDCRNKKGDK